MAKTISVRRKGYRRKGYTAIRRGKKVKVGPARVNPSPLEEGALGGPGFFDRSEAEQERIAFERARDVGEKKAVGELRALQVFFKKTQPEKSRRALELSKKVAGSFKGKEEVEYPEGLRRKQ
jgi:hypothetical protein